VREDDGAIADKIFVQGNARERLWQQAGESCLAPLNRQPAEILAVEFEQVKGAEYGGVVVAPGTE
jgi:hypothetical protein